jgi:hypothetical protein
MGCLRVQIAEEGRVDGRREEMGQGHAMVYIASIS